MFMYVQCKMYIQLCHRWRAYNRVIYVQDCSSCPPHRTSSSGHKAVNADEMRADVTAKSEHSPCVTHIESTELQLL